MPARKWTLEQRARQGQIIHNWKPWTNSTGAKTKEGKAISSKNAVNYSLREIMRYTSRTNKELSQQLEPFVRLSNWMEATGMYERATPDKVRNDPAILDGLLADFEKAWELQFGKD